MKDLEAIETHGFRSILSKYDILGCYVFGSHARDKASPLSDIDIAVFLDDDVKSSAYADCQIDLTVDFIRFFQRQDIDVVILNNAYPAVAFKAISTGKLIFEKNRSRRIMAETRIRKTFFDMAHLRKVLNDGMEKRLA